ncbi:chorismate mutase [Methylomusa anaerophila]|uniref:chorismate mutase n=1 Tax=Methylomusa anaerophila TaxID=1930071 RepID=UPI002D1FA12F|nr:chorismate mutase [Methylomusa anaerophila]
MNILRGVRGATTVINNDRQEISVRVIELLNEIVKENGLEKEDIAAAIFSSTPDLNAGFPAVGARMLGWNEVPLFGTQEVECPDALPRCIRVLILWNTDRNQNQIKHIYLHHAVALRQDIADQPV